MSDSEFFDKPTCFMLGAGIVVGIVWFVTITVGLKSTAEWERQAVKEGVGEYYLDADNQRQFRWKKKD